MQATADTHWRQELAAAGGMLRRGFMQFLGFELFFRFLGAVLFVPVSAWMAARLIQRSGSGAVSNYDLAAFLLSVHGLVYLMVVVTLAFVLLFFEFGGLCLLAISLQREDAIRLPRLFRLLGAELPRLWRLALRQFLLYLAVAGPCLAVAGGAYLLFLTKSDIYYYLTVKPPAFWYAAAIMLAAGLLFTVFAGRLLLDWIFSVPVLLLTRVPPVQALRESRKLVRGRRWNILGLLLAWAALVAVLLVAVRLIMTGLEAGLLGLVGRQVGVVLTVIAFLSVVQFILAGAVSIGVFALLACVISGRFLRLCPDVELPATLLGDEHAVIRRITRALRAGWVIMALLILLTALAAYELVNQVDVRDSVGITAHRGSSITAPENTMAAILLAVDEGADMVEIDVQETADGVVVLVHDKDLKRVFGIEKGIWEVSYDEIKDLDSGSWFSPDFSDQRIATLDQVIKAVRGKAGLNIELKFNGHEQKLASEVVRIVKENDFLDRCILTSLDYQGLGRVRTAAPDARTGVIVTSSIGDITRLDADLLSVSAKAVTRDLVARAHGRGLEVHVWTVNDVARMNTMIGMGVDHIITDDPKLLGALLKERAGMSNGEKVLLQLLDLARWRRGASGGYAP